MTYLDTKFEVATSNSLEENTFTRNVTDGRTHGHTDRQMTDRLWYQINIKKNADITSKGIYTSVPRHAFSFNFA